MARRKQRDYVRKNWKHLSIALVGMLSLIATCTALMPAGFVRGFFAGGCSASVIGALAFRTVQSTGTAATMMGDEAEQWTASELRKLRSRGWRVVNHVNLRPWDIDHVLVGPGGIYAVETKWSARPWSLDNDDQRVCQALAQARRNAKDLLKWHEFKKLGIVNVEHVVVLWGAGVGDVPVTLAMRVVEDGCVVAGPHAGAWAETLPVNVLTKHQTDQAWCELDRHVRRRDPHEVLKNPLAPSIHQMVVRACLVTVVAVSAFLLAVETVRVTNSIYAGAATCALLFGAAAAARKTAGLTHIAWGMLLGATFGVMLGSFAVAYELLAR